MDALNLIFSRTDIESMLVVVACVLHLGNLTFTLNPKKNETSPDQPSLLTLIGRLLNVDASALQLHLTHQCRNIRGEIMQTQMELNQITDRRDAVAKVGDVFISFPDAALSHVNHCVVVV